MFQGMFRKRGRPPEPLPIGGYDKPNNEQEETSIPVHQYWKRRDCHLSGNWNQMLLCNKSKMWVTVEGVTFNVPDLPFSQRNEIFSETSSRI